MRAWTREHYAEDWIYRVEQRGNQSMAIDLEAERDLSLIFERDDVREAFLMHCRGSHPDGELRKCPDCLRLLGMLADAITEWLALVDQDRAARR